jgi:hypothetical protein
VYRRRMVQRAGRVGTVASIDMCTDDGVSAGITPDRIGQLYERLGYTEKFTIYKKPNNHL